MPTASEGADVPSPDPARTSVWHGTARTTSYPPLSGDTYADVLVVGAGITGLTTALLLSEAGARVTVVEALGIAAGTTGGTTGKVTSQHGVIYDDLARQHGDRVARDYGRANEAAIRQLEDLCRRYDIDADLVPADAYVYARDDAEVERLRTEFAATQRAGLPSEWADADHLPFGAAAAVRFRSQAQLHPVKYGEGLARAVDALPDGAVHTTTRVVRIRQAGSRVVVDTDHGRVTAGHVVMGTLAPITDRGFEFARATPVRAYGIAAEVTGSVPDGMYITAGEPLWSVRGYHGERGRYVIVVGGSHEVGHVRDTSHRNDELERFARDHFDVREVAFRWSAQDLVADDRLPFIGRTAFSDRVYVATGFRKWGLTNGTVAAQVITDLVTGRDSPYAEIFSPTRGNVAASARSFLQHNADVAVRFVRDRVRPDVASIDDIPAGSGATVRVDGRLLAVSKDHEGNTVSRSAICTHLGCVVQFNEGEKSWDCPCHGSRFATDGTVLNGPATEGLRNP